MAYVYIMIALTFALWGKSLAFNISVRADIWYTVQYSIV